MKHEENEVTEKVEEIKEHLDDFDVEGITEFLDELRGRAPFDLERDDPERLKRIRKSTVEEFHQDLEALYSNAKLLEEEINPEINQIEGEILPELFSEIDFLQDLDEEMEDLEIEEIEIEEKLARRNKNRIKHAGGGPVSTDASKNKLDFQSEEVKRTVSELKTIMEKKKRLEKMIKADENLAEKDEKGIVEVLEQIKTDISAIMERLADQNKRGLPLYDLLRREVSDEFEDLHGRVKTYKDHHPNFKPGAPSEEAKVVSSSAAEVKELYESLVELSGSVNEIKREIAG